MVLFWDFDRTLAVRTDGWSGAVLTLLKKNGYDNVSIGEIRPLLSTGFPWHTPDIPHTTFLNGMSWWERMEQLFENIFGQLGANAADARNMSRKVRETYLNMSNWTVYQDTPETLEICRRKGFRSFILSNHVPELFFFAEQIGISMYFEKIYSSGNIGFEKPNPKFFLHVLADSGIGVNEAIMIGDSYPVDILGAAAMGMKAILVHSENTPNYPLYSRDLKGILNFL